MSKRKQSSQNKIKSLAQEFQNGSRPEGEILADLDAVVDATNDWAALMQAGALRRKLQDQITGGNQPTT